MRKMRPRPRLLSFLALSVCFCLLAFACLALMPENVQGPYDLDDEELKPFIAMFEVDRQQYCLAEINKDSAVEFRKTDGEGGYDAELLIRNGGKSRSVFFARENDRYVWIGELEIHESGRWFDTVDGRQPEEIVIAYYSRSIQGGIKGLNILYFGDNERIQSPLTCGEALSIIRGWETETTEPTSGYK